MYHLTNFTSASSCYVEDRSYMTRKHTGVCIRLILVDQLRNQTGDSHDSSWNQLFESETECSQKHVNPEHLSRINYLVCQHNKFKSFIDYLTHFLHRVKIT